jgi:hypothetical protein
VSMVSSVHHVPPAPSRPRLERMAFARRVLATIPLHRCKARRRRTASARPASLETQRKARSAACVRLVR